MNFNLAWVVDFRKESLLDKLLGSFQTENWCKVSRFSDLIPSSQEISEKDIEAFFVDQKYIDSLNWSFSRSPKAINVYLIADDDQIINACLFAYHLKNNYLEFLNANKLQANTEFSCNLISYWDFFWSKTEEEEKINNLYALNFFQNINSIQRRPFNFAFIFKDINPGLASFEYRHQDKNREYFDSKITSLIFFISNENQTLIKKLNADKWCVSFGASFTYFDASVFYAQTSKELSNLILKDLISEELEPWHLIEDKPLKEKLHSFEVNNVFNSIKYQSAQSNPSTKSFYYLDLTPLWDWFGLPRLKKFFDDELSQMLFLLKKGKVEFLFESYNEMRSMVEINYRKFIDFKNNNIKTPGSIFEEYYQLKPFSFQAYRIGLEKLIKQIEELKEENRTSFKKLYPDSKTSEPYNPCSMNPEVSKIYKDFSEELNDKDGLTLQTTVENQLLKIKEKSENIPQPLSLLVKTVFMSTLLVLMAYIPLTRVFNEQLWLVYTLLTVLFIVPFAFTWNRFKASVRELYHLSCEFEALSKYYITRKLAEKVNRTIEDVYDEYQNLCQQELSKIEIKIKDIEEYLKLTHKSETSYPDKLSIRSATSIAEKTPPVQITIDGNHFKTKDLEGNSEKLYQYFKQTISNTKTTLSDLINNKLETFDNIIIEQLKSYSDNISSASDLLFPSVGVNIEKKVKDEMLNLLSPYNNGDKSIDDIKIEIIADSSNGINSHFLEDLFNYYPSKPSVTAISGITSENNIISGAISIITLNQPNNNVFDLFSASLGGNKFTFVDFTKKFLDKKPSDFENIRNKIIKAVVSEDTNKKFEVSNNTNNNLVFEIVFKGFDLRFDRDSWELNTFENLEEDTDNEMNHFVKEIRKNHREQFDIEVQNKLKGASKES